MFFTREDADKKFMLEQIKRCKNPDAALADFNSWAKYRPEINADWKSLGFFYVVRNDFENDTREETLAKLVRYFGLK